MWITDAFAFLLHVLVIAAYESLDIFESEPLFDAESENITAIAGETAILPCEVESKGEYKVIWMNPRKTLISRDDSRYIDDTRMSIERPNIKDWNLHIRELRHNDSGEYMCQINTKPVEIKRIYLFVQVPPEIVPEWSSEGDIKVPEGATVDLVCNATGVPPPTVRWYRQSNTIPDYGSPNDKYEARKMNTVKWSMVLVCSVSDRGTSLIGEVLILHNITRYCDGFYKCEAENGVPYPAALKIFQVTVEFPPEVYLPNKRIGQELGKETILLCRVSASPHGSISWRKDGHKLPFMPYKYTTEVFADDTHQKTLTLNIINIDEEDFGEYTCEANNALGSDRETMVLYEYTVKTGRPPARPTLPPIWHSTVTDKPILYPSPISSVDVPGQTRMIGNNVPYYYNAGIDLLHSKRKLLYALTVLVINRIVVHSSILMSECLCK